MNQTPDATAVFAPLWARKWLILAIALVVAGATYAYYKNKPTVYQVATQLYLGGKSEEQGLLGERGSGGKSTANLGNQAALINSALINQAARRKLRKEAETNPAAAAAVKGKAKAKASEKNPFIQISSEAQTPKGAALLANTIAETYIARQRVNYIRAVESVIAITRHQLRRLEAAQLASSKGKKSSSVGTVQIAQLSTKITQLESELAVAGAQQVTKANPRAATLLSPHPRKNVVFGFVIGALLACVLAYMLSRFDRRVRSLAQVESITGAQILTALPEVKNPVLRRDGVPSTSKPLLEPIRRLQSALRVAPADGRPAPRSILFVSADAGDGKSTVAANLALAQRDAGEHVALLEANFRRPVQARLLNLDAERGLADVLTGAGTSEQAMQVVPAPASENGHVALPAGNGSLSVLIGGGDVANPQALLAAPIMSELIRSLAEATYCVLVDAPSPLQFSDAMPLLSAVDGIVLVVRIGHTREVSARRLQEQLSRTASAPVLGVVANGAKRSDIERYGFSTGPTTGRRRLALSGR